MRSRRVGIIFMIIGTIILILSLIYEFLFEGQEGISGAIVGIVGIFIGVQFFSTNQVINAIKNLREDLKEGNQGDKRRY